MANCGFTSNDNLNPSGFSGWCGPSKKTFTVPYPRNGQHPTSSHGSDELISLISVLKLHVTIVSETWATGQLPGYKNTNHCPVLTYFSPNGTTQTQLLRASLIKTLSKTAVNTEPTAKLYISKGDELSSICLFSLYK